MKQDTREAIQENQYHFPYHFLARYQNNTFSLSRHLEWGLMHASYIYDIVDKVIQLTPCSVLDAGCGDGRLVCEIEACDPNIKIQGVDISETSLHFARGFSKRANIYKLDLTKEVAVEAVDVCISIEVIEHIKPSQINDYISNISKSLNAGGHLILSTPTTNIPVSKKHYQHFSIESLEKYLSREFEIVSVEYQNIMNNLFNIVSRLIANKHFIITNRRLNGFVYRLYIKYCFKATESTGSRICIIAKKRQA